METNKMDKIVQKAFENRTFQPSASAWERLESQLDKVLQKPKRSWFMTVGYAASILLIISAAFFINTSNEIQPITPNGIVVNSIDTIKFKKHDFKTVVPLIEEALVKNTPNDKMMMLKKQHTVVNSKKNPQNAVYQKTKQLAVKETSIAFTEKVKIIPSKILKNKIKITTVSSIDKQPVIHRIKIDSDALLYAVTHSESEVKQYYAKYNVNRGEALKTIKKELKKMNLKIDAKSMLLAIEKKIDEDTFKRSFMKTIKGKVSGLAIAFSNRNN